MLGPLEDGEVELGRLFFPGVAAPCGFDEGSWKVWVSGGHRQGGGGGYQTG